MTHRDPRPEAQPDEPPLLVLDARATLGEGATWDAATARLLWVDILGRTVHRLDPVTGTDERWSMPAEPGCVVPAVDGRLAVALPDGIHLLDPDDGSLVPWATVPHDSERFILNDGYCDPVGRLWVGSMERDAAPGLAALYRVDVDGTVTTALDGVTCSNGIGWSPDGRTMVYVDSTTRRIDAFAYDVATGTISSRRALVELPPGPELPDGLTVDAHGGIWVAMWDGAAVHRYRPDGVLDRVVDVGTPRPTSCALGGPSLDELYITSARVELDESVVERTRAGAVWRTRVSVPGQAGAPLALAVPPVGDGR